MMEDRAVMTKKLRPFRAVAIAACVASLTSSPADAQLRNLIAKCGDAQATAGEIVNFCQRALASRGLSAQQRAQIGANLGVGLYEQGRFRDAVAAYTDALRDAPNMAALYVNRARASEKLRDLQTAVADYGEALRLDPRAADAFLGRGALLLSNGDPGRAISDFNAALSLQPSWIAPRFNRGVAYLRLSDPVSAELDFTAVLRANPDDAGAYLNRGRARAMRGDPLAGIDYDRALQIDPEWGGGWFARGQYFDRNGNREAANRDFLRAYELGYPDPWLIQRVREISG